MVDISATLAPKILETWAKFVLKDSIVQLVLRCQLDVHIRCIGVAQVQLMFRSVDLVQLDTIVSKMIL